MGYFKLLILAIMTLHSLTTVFGSEECVPENCMATTTEECNGHGTCNCSTCICKDGYSGPTCEECPTCRTPCEMFAPCVSCKIFYTGDMNFMECLQTCDRIANFHPVEKVNFPLLGIVEGMQTCHTINDMDCLESFKIAGMSVGTRTLYVQPDMDCDVDLSLYNKEVSTKHIPTSTEKTTSTSVKPTKEKVMEKNDEKSETDTITYGEPEQSDVVSGSSKVSDSNNGGSRSGLQVSVFLCLWILAVLL